MWIDSSFTAWAAVIALLFAFCLDRWFGDPVARWHPVAWMRRCAAGARGPMGAVAWWGGMAGFALAAGLLQWALLHLNEAIGGLLLGSLLKSMLSWRSLRAEVGDAPVQLARPLAERLTDCVVAPVFWFLAAGLPGAVAYRFASAVEGPGQAGARTRDVLALVPTFITLLLLTALGRGPHVADRAVAVLLAWTCLAMFLLSLRPW